MRSIQSFQSWKKENYKFKKCFSLGCNNQTLKIFCLDCLDIKSKEYDAKNKDKNVK